jgi:hypothetical protein
MLARGKGIEMGDCKSDENFLEQVLQRDYFWNLRDIADGVRTPVLRDKVFRGACLAHLSELELDNFLRRTKIEWIVDLRNDVEWKRRPYPIDFPVTVVRCPTGNLTERPMGWPEPELASHRDYIGYLVDLICHIPKILTLLASQKSGYIHCYAGRDRTGAVCALILRLLGCNSDEIEISYSMSSEVDMKAIRSLTSWFGDDNVFNSILADIGVDGLLARKTRAALLESPKLVAGR